MSTTKKIQLHPLDNNEEILYPQTSIEQVEGLQTELNSKVPETRKVAGVSLENNTEDLKNYNYETTSETIVISGLEENNIYKFKSLPIFGEELPSNPFESFYSNIDGDMSSNGKQTIISYIPDNLIYLDGNPATFIVEQNIVDGGYTHVKILFDRANNIWRDMLNSYVEYDVSNISFVLHKVGMSTYPDGTTDWCSAIFKHILLNEDGTEIEDTEETIIKKKNLEEELADFPNWRYIKEHNFVTLKYELDISEVRGELSECAYLIDLEDLLVYNDEKNNISLKYSCSVPYGSGSEVFVFKWSINNEEYICTVDRPNESVTWNPSYLSQEDMPSFELYSDCFIIPSTQPPYGAIPLTGVLIHKEYIASKTLKQYLNNYKDWKFDTSNEIGVLYTPKWDEIDQFGTIYQYIPLEDGIQTIIYVDGNNVQKSVGIELTNTSTGDTDRYEIYNYIPDVINEFVPKKNKWYYSSQKNEQWSEPIIVKHPEMTLDTQYIVSGYEELFNTIYGKLNENLENAINNLQIDNKAVLKNKIYDIIDDDTLAQPKFNINEDDIWDIFDYFYEYQSEDPRTLWYESDNMNIYFYNVEYDDETYNGAFSIDYEDDTYKYTLDVEITYDEDWNEYISQTWKKTPLLGGTSIDISSQEELPIFNYNNKYFVIEYGPEASILVINNPVQVKKTLEDVIGGDLKDKIYKSAKLTNGSKYSIREKDIDISFPEWGGVDIYIDSDKGIYLTIPNGEKSFDGNREYYLSYYDSINNIDICYALSVNEWRINDTQYPSEKYEGEMPVITINENAIIDKDRLFKILNANNITLEQHDKDLKNWDYEEISTGYKPLFEPTTLNYDILDDAGLMTPQSNTNLYLDTTNHISLDYNYFESMGSASIYFEWNINGTVYSYNFSTNIWMNVTTMTPITSQDDIPSFDYNVNNIISGYESVVTTLVGETMSTKSLDQKLQEIASQSSSGSTIKLNNVPLTGTWYLMPTPDIPAFPWIYVFQDVYNMIPNFTIDMIAKIVKVEVEFTLDDSISGKFCPIIEFDESLGELVIFASEDMTQSGTIISLRTINIIITLGENVVSNSQSTIVGI